MQAWQSAKSVAAFLALRDEPRIGSLWQREGSRSFCFPRASGQGPELIRISDVASLETADWQLRGERFEACPRVSPAEVDLFLVPGVAFTSDGKRLGRGGGFYDRLLAQASPQALKIGVCFASRVVPAIVTEAHDQRLDFVVTEGGVLSH